MQRSTYFLVLIIGFFFLFIGLSYLQYRPIFKQHGFAFSFLQLIITLLAGLGIMKLSIGKHYQRFALLYILLFSGYFLLLVTATFIIKKAALVVLTLHYVKFFQLLSPLPLLVYFVFLKIQPFINTTKN